MYTHPDYPHEPKVSHKIKPEIRKCVEKYWQVHLSPPWSSKYLRKIITKGINGQPVSFTDFYGYLVGQQLLKGVSYMLVFLKLVHTESQVNHKTQPFWVKVVHLCSTQCSNPSWACRWHHPFGTNNYPLFQHSTKNQLFIPALDFYFLLK